MTNVQDPVLAAQESVVCYACIIMMLQEIGWNDTVATVLWYNINFGYMFAIATSGNIASWIGISMYVNTYVNEDK